MNTAQGQLVSIKDLKTAVDSLQSALDAAEAQKDDYANWNEVERKLNSAKTVLDNANATETSLE